MNLKWLPALFILASCHLSTHQSGSHQQGISTSHECRPQFPFTDTWVGADGGNSILLDPDTKKSLWIFGDTFMSHDGAGDRHRFSMPSITIGVSSCHLGDFQIEYFWQGESPSFQPYFSPGNDEHYWPGDGIKLGDQVYIYLHRIKKSPEFPFGFQNRGTDLAMVSGLERSPDQWDTQIIPLSSTTEFSFGRSVLEEGDYLYLGGNLTDRNAIFMVRTRKDQITNPEALEVQKADLGWEPLGTSYQRADLNLLVEYGAAEFSIEKTQGQYLMVYTEHFFPSSKAMIATSPSLDQPFTNLVTTYPYPDDDHFGKDLFCYAAKHHPQFSRSDALLMTYIGNADFFKTLPHNLEAYKLKSVWVPFPIHHR